MIDGNPIRPIDMTAKLLCHDQVAGRGGGYHCYAHHSRRIEG